MKGFLKKLWGGNEAPDIRNQEALRCLKELRYPLASIRKAMLVLNQVQIRKFVNGKAPSMVYQTIRGTRRDKQVMKAVADELRVEIEDVFPDSESPRVE